MESFPDPPTTASSSLKVNGDEAAEHQIGRRARSGSGGSAHKRSLSGNLFSRLQFLRSNPDEHSQDTGPDGSASTVGDATGSATQQKKPRRRKGSLRKTALLGGRERKGSDAKSKSPISSEIPVPEEFENNTAREAQANDATPRQSYDRPQRRPEPAVPHRHWSSPRISIASIDSTAPSIDPPSSTISITSPTAPTEASFTDDDEPMAFPRLQTGALRQPPSSSGDSYFPPLQRGRSSSKKTSPLATQPHSEVISPMVEEEWDYSETAYWGYVILIVTWLVFVVGMGSCFGVWSWAWDVGETPYAPPELEDDPTLPIVGYYPALLVLTAVMSWVWVITSWVGLKYFRHADYGRDDD